MTLDPTKLAGVRSAAEKATPGIRTVYDDNEGVNPPRPLWKVSNEHYDADGDAFEEGAPLDLAIFVGSKDDAAFIALVDPPTAIALCDEIERLTKRNVEVATLAHGWMVAHDKRAAGLPYDLPTPADVPAAQSEAARWREKAEGLEEVASEVLAPFAAHELEAARLQPDAKPVSDRFKIAVPAGSLRKLRSALSTQTQGGGENG